MEFKVGDRVKCVSNYFQNTVGQKGTILGLDKDSKLLIAVEFDRNIDGHSCNGMGKRRHCYWLRKEYLKLINDETVAVPFETQTTDYEIKSDQGKPRLSLVPINGIWKAIANIREYGVKKYTDTESWKQVETQRYWDAVLRHISACTVDMNAVDEESGMLHRWHVECNLAFIEELENR